MLLYEKLGSVFGFSPGRPNSERAPVPLIFQMAPVRNAFRVGLLVFFAYVALHQICAAQSQTYLQKKGDEQTILKWRLQKMEEGLRILSTAGERRFVNTCLSSGETLRWRMIGPDTDIIAVRDDQELSIQGIVQGEPFKQQQTLGSLSWFQPLSFSLRSLLDSRTPSRRFWMIHPETLKVHKLFAETAGIEQVSINGKPIKAARIDVSLNRLIGSFFNASYWFRLSDRLFVQFEGRDGLFGRSVQIQLFDPE